MEFALGMLTGGALAYGLSFWLYRSMQRDDQWWQANEGRRNWRWPVMKEANSDGE